MMGRRKVIIVGLITLLAGMGVGALRENPKAEFMLALPPDVWLDDTGLNVAALASIVANETEQEGVMDALRVYYESNREALASIFDEGDDTRLRGLFGMYIVHLAVPYNVVIVPPTTLFEFVNAPSAHCGTYSVAQSWIYDALGVEWRIVMVDGGWHGLIEVDVGGSWEIFDSTVNMWIDRSVEQLLAGEVRTYRTFYTPILDENASEIYRDHMAGGWDVLGLREGLPLWGVSVFPTRWEVAQS